MPHSIAPAGLGNGYAATAAMSAAHPFRPTRRPAPRSCRRLPILLGGCCFAEHPALPAWRARIFFDAATDPSVLPCDIVGEDPSGFDLATVGCFSAVLRGSEPFEHVVLTDGLRRMRLDVRGGTVTRMPVRLRFIFDGLRSIDAPLLTLRRLVAFDRRGTMPLGLFEKERRGARWISALRADDARRAGASHRDVAQVLYGAKRVREDWPGPSDYLRSQVRRLLRFSERMRGGGWRSLLGSNAGDPL